MKMSLYEVDYKDYLSDVIETKRIDGRIEMSGGALCFWGPLDLIAAFSSGVWLTVVPVKEEKDACSKVSE